MSTDSIYWFLHDKDYKQSLEKLNNSPKEDLISLIINERYNNFIDRYADMADGESPLTQPIENGKRIPYMGWFWRNLDFANGRIPIGFEDDSSYVGFMANNKWGYPERNLTPEEFEILMSLIDDAMRINEEGGDLAKLLEKYEALEKIYPFLQSLKFE